MGGRQRRPFNQRIKNPPRLWLTPRDREVVKAVHEYRFLLRDQVQKLFFPSRNTANARLLRLFQHGMLQRIFIPEDERRNARNTQAAYIMDQEGAQLLGVPFRKRSQVKTFFLKHLITLNDLRIALTLAAKKHGDHLAKWVPEWKLKKNVKQRDARTGKIYPVSPDAYFTYEIGKSRKWNHFFVEVDMNTMQQWNFGKKISAYIQYKRSGAYRKHYGTHSLRVLTVVPNQTRLQSLKLTTEKLGGSNMFWFTTFDALSPEKILQSIWYIAGHERTATLFDG